MAFVIQESLFLSKMDKDNRIKISSKTSCFNLSIFYFIFSVNINLLFMYYYDLYLIVKFLSI